MAGPAAVTAARGIGVGWASPPRAPRGKGFRGAGTLEVNPRRPAICAPVLCVSPSSRKGSEGGGLLLPGRRTALAGLAGVSSALVALQPPPALAAPLDFAARLGDPLAAPLYSPGRDFSPFKERELLYPRWLQGEWDVKAMLRAAEVPLGNRFAPLEAKDVIKAPADEGGVGSTLAYVVRFLPFEGAVLADRAYNMTSLIDAVYGYSAVATSVFDPARPGRQRVEFAQLSPDLQPLPPQRWELYFENPRSSGLPLPGAPPSPFSTSEVYRVVRLGVRSVTTTDCEIVTRYQRVAEGEGGGRGGGVRAAQRLIVYMQPQDDLYFEAGGKAVAVLDWDLEMAPRGA